MHADNRRLGQSQIFAVYVDPEHRYLDHWSPPSIRGHVQSDWDLTARTVPDDGLLTAFVWSPAARRRRIAAGLRPGFVLGSPWAYAQRVPRDAFRTWQEVERRAEDPPPPVVARGTLYLPTHGIQGVHHARQLAAHLGRRQAAGPVTVALTPADEAAAGIGAAYTDAGCAVVGLGSMDNEPGAPEPRYLVRLLDLITRHERVLANGPRVELLYAATTGRTVGIEGPVIGEQDPVLTGLAHRLTTLDAPGWRSYADRELGTAQVVPPDELRTLLDWIDHD